MTIVEELKKFAPFLSATVDETQTRAFDRIRDRKDKYGINICPCTFVAENIPTNELLDLRCPCKNALDDVIEKGSCHCKVFVRR